MGENNIDNLAQRAEQEMDRDYGKFYERITAGIRSRRNGRKALNTADRLLAGVMYAAYPVLILCIASGGLLQGSGILEAGAAVLPYLLIPGVSFILLSAVRKRMNWKRPYEEWPMDPMIRREKKGRSMPSRHVFSAAVISMCILRRNAALGIIFLGVSVCIAVVRVLGGVHYPRDVIAGYLLGAAAGSLLWMM